MKRQVRANRRSHESQCHKRNPPIRSLMDSKRYQQVTPKHAMMNQVFFPQNVDIQDLELEAKISPKIEL